MGIRAKSGVDLIKECGLEGTKKAKRWAHVGSNTFKLIRIPILIWRCKFVPPGSTQFYLLCKFPRNFSIYTHKYVSLHSCKCAPYRLSKFSNSQALNSVKFVHLHMYILEYFGNKITCFLGQFIITITIRQPQLDPPRFFDSVAIS